MTGLLFTDPVQRRLRDHEAERIYEDVLALRKTGLRVCRCGKNHKVDGKIVTHLELRWLAKIARKM